MIKEIKALVRNTAVVSKGKSMNERVIESHESSPWEKRKREEFLENLYAYDYLEDYDYEEEI